MNDLLVRNAVVALLELVHQGVFTLERVVEKHCHAPARMFQVERCGRVREGYRADLVLVELNAPWTVAPANLLYKCGWSPFDGATFRARVKHTFVNGRHVYADGRLDRTVRWERLRFDR
jgi:dihydroorotase